MAGRRGNQPQFFFEFSFPFQMGFYQLKWIAAHENAQQVLFVQFAPGLYSKRDLPLGQNSSSFNFIECTLSAAQVVASLDWIRHGVS